MNTMLLALLCCLLPLSASWPQQTAHAVDEHAQDSLEQQLRQLIKTQRTGDAKSLAAASRAIAKLRETRYPDCYNVYKQSKDDVLRAFLGQALHVEEIRAAHTILLAKAPRGEHAQGGVIDHHDLWLQFEQHEVLFADATANADHLIDKRFLLATGTHEDTWLCDLLRRDVEAHAATQIWVLKRRLLMHANGQSGLTLHEFVRVPANAAATIRELRK